MTKALIGILGLALVACSGSQPGPMGDGGEECSTSWYHSENFTPPEPPTGESAECMVVVADGDTVLLYGAARDKCDAFAESNLRMRVRWPNSISVFKRNASDSFHLEACD